MQDIGYKSYNIIKDIDKFQVIEIQGTKKRVFFDYDLEDFLERINYE
jgi:hypothetical protein